jgi:hypothetical protein
MKTKPPKHGAESARPPLPFNPDALYAQFTASSREAGEARKRRNRRALAKKASFYIPELAELTGLSNAEVYKLIVDHAIEANEVSGTWTMPSGWLIPRDEVYRLVRRHAAERNCQVGLDYLAAVEEDEEEESSEWR